MVKNVGNGENKFSYIQGKYYLWTEKQIAVRQYEDTPAEKENCHNWLVSCNTISLWEVLASPSGVIMYPPPFF